MPNLAAGSGFRDQGGEGVVRMDEGLSVMLPPMPKGKPLVVTVLGVANIIKCLFIGLLYFIPGLLITPLGQGFIFGIPMVLLGFVLLLGVKPAFLLLRQHPKGRMMTIILSIVSSGALFIVPSAFPIVPLFVHSINALNLYLFVPRVADQFHKTDQKILTSNEKKLILACVILGTISTVLLILYGFMRPHFNPYHPTPEMIQSMKGRIKREFEKKDSVVLIVYYHPPYWNNPDYRQSDETEKERVNEKFIIDTYLKVIGFESKDLKHFIKGRGYTFIVEVTEPGYEKLRRCKHLRALKLYDSKSYRKRLWN